jgi:hypothetical protein
MDSHLGKQSVVLMGFLMVLQSVSRLVLKWDELPVGKSGHGLVNLSAVLLECM